ncbi:MAG: MFS transporter [Candidatus Rokubacteria bacterium]|nr:MFS transporter [Candidatus Rokubacteria bacterium]
MISISTVLVMAGQGVIAPILPLFARDFGVGTAAIGLTLSTFALARLLLNVPLGVVSDRLGRRPLLIGGPLVTAIGMIGSGIAPDIYQLLAWRFVAGAGSAMYMTGAQIYLADISTPLNRARFIGTNQGALLLGTSSGPAIGGAVAELWGLRAPFHVVGVAALVAMVYAWARLPETRGLVAEEAEAEAEAARAAGRAGGAARAGGRAWLRMIRSRDFFAVAWVTMSVFFTRTASRQTLVPVMAAARLGISAGALGAVFTMMSLVNMFLIAPAAVIADRWGRKWAIVPSGLLVALSLVMMANANGWALFLAAAVLMAVATGVAGPAPAAYAADIAPPELRGLAMGLYRSSGDVGFLIGPPLLGAIADATSYGWGFGANALLIGAASLFFLVAARETMGRGAARPARA